jgi:hypothetical protein
MELPSLLKGVAAMLWDSSEIAVQNDDYSGRHDPFRVQPWTCVVLCIAHALLRFATHAGASIASHSRLFRKYCTHVRG